VAVTIDDLRHVAALARLGLDEARAHQLVGELNTILDHMSVLAAVETEGVGETAAMSAVAGPLRADHGPPIPLARSPEGFAPVMRDGFFLVPRLATHEDTESAS
jgi:aspartyl-tRNA(Asn)/glutamyl-tRNA(Gln) amidotransferase subunit C